MWVIMDLNYLLKNLILIIIAQILEELWGFNQSSHFIQNKILLLTIELTLGDSIYSISAKSSIKIEETIFKNIQDIIENNNYESISSIYIKFSSTDVTCIRNTYENLLGFTKGGVFFLEEVRFIDSESLYMNNNAI